MRQPQHFGRYVLLERISVGGMAEVFKARPVGAEGEGRLLAIKRILPSMAEDADFIQMFIDEAKIAGQLNHSNIAQIYELGRVDDSHFIAMEFVWGKDLLQIQNRFRRIKQTMSPTMAAFVAARICDGLDYAHKKTDPTGRLLGIIHRDVSPQNILVSYDGEVKVIDFGIAKAASRATKTQAGVLKGKFGYMSPEQVRGFPLDRRSDIFAIATILYELLTAERLFLGESDFATLEKVRNVDVPRPSVACPACPPELERIILKGLAKNVEDRYQWGSEMVADLEAFLATQPAFSGRMLAAWMREQFAVEIKREQAALDELRRAAAQAGRPPSPTGEGPSGGHKPGQISANMPTPVPTAGAPLGAATMLLHTPSSATPNGRPQATPSASSTLMLDVNDLELASELEALAAEYDAEAPGDATQITGPDFALFAEHAVAQPAAMAAAGGEAAAHPVDELAAQSTRILDGGAGPAGGDMLAQATRILDAGSDVSEMPAQATVLLETSPPAGTSYPVARPHAAAAAVTPPRGTASAITPFPTPSPSQTGHDPATTHVPSLPYTPHRRSHVLRDVLLGTLLAALLVAAAVGAKIYLLGAPRRGGTLVVTVNPPSRSTVLVDGRERGQIDPGGGLTLKEIAAGRHHVAVRSAAGSFDRDVTVGADDVAVVHALLVDATAGAGVGKVRVDVKTPGASVYIDGAQLDEEALHEAIPLPAGTAHEIRVTAPGHDEQRFPVKLTAGESLTREVDLPVAVASLSVHTDPPGADVRINGKAAGVSPLAVDTLDPTQPARVTMSKRGFATVTRTVKFDTSRHQSLDVKLVVSLIGAAEGGAGAAEPEPVEVVEDEAPVAAPEPGPGPGPGKAAGGGSKPGRGGGAAAHAPSSEAPAPAAASAGAVPSGGAAPAAAAAPPAGGAKARATDERKSAASATPGPVVEELTDARPEPRRAARSTPAGDDDGFLVANSTPWSKVIVDGKDTGRMTPIPPTSRLPLKPGKHVVTFLVNGKRYSYDVQIATGQVSRLIRTLADEPQ